MFSFLSSLLLLALVSRHAVFAQQRNWSEVDQAMLQQIAIEAFPGATGLIAQPGKVLHTFALGNYTYGIPPPVNGKNVAVQLDTLFDMASLTKVLVTTTCVMTFYQRGELPLDTLVSDPRLLGPHYANNGKGIITVENLLLHNAGYPPDPDPEYWDPVFGCPQSQFYYPKEVFSCQQLVIDGLLNQTLVYPVGSQFIYSDLSMITMMYVVGTLARDLGYVKLEDLRPDCIADAPDPFTPLNGAEQCFYEAYARKYVIDYLGLENSFFLPDISLWGNCMPTWNDTDGYSPGPGYRHRVIQGQVSDQNAYAMGGISGHAGYFSNSPDAFTLLNRLMAATPSDPWINSTTVKLFTTIHNVTQSSRALGWDTNSYYVENPRLCGNFSSDTYTHTGYTGTMVCSDPDRQLIAVLLTNRVYPFANDTSEDKIAVARQLFSNLVVQIFDSQSLQSLSDPFGKAQEAADLAPLFLDLEKDEEEGF